MAKGKFDMSEFLKPAAVPESDTGREQIVYLPLDQLRADENNFYSLDGIDELAANIELIGLQQPIRVRKDGDGYIIVSGHRRSAALRLLVEDGQKRFAEAPCIIERDDGESPAMRELRLICANSDTRKMFVFPEVIAREREATATVPISGMLRARERRILRKASTAEAVRTAQR